ncbi:fimbria major subunit [Phocaeicola sp.]
MKFNKYYLMSAVFCMALASCSDDVVDDQGGKLDTEQTESVKNTYVSFKLNFTSTSSRALSSTTDIAGAEKAVKDYALFVFKCEEGADQVNTLELYETKTADQTLTNDAFNTGAYLISSGTKKIFVVVNGANNGLVLTEINKQLGADKPLTINKTLLSDFEKLKFDMAYTDNTASVLGGATADLGNGLLMTGVAKATLEDGVTEAEVFAQQNPKNTVEIGVDRASAKITIGVNTTNLDNSKFLVQASNSTIQNPFGADKLDSKLGTISAVNYAMFNLNKAEYLVAREGNVVGNGTDNNGIRIFEDPNYAYSSDADLYSDAEKKNLWYHQNTVSVGSAEAAKDYVDFYTTFGDNTKSIGKVVPMTLAGDAALNPSYIPENTNEFAVKGNTTYAMLEATFVPEKTRSVDMGTPIATPAANTSALFNQAQTEIEGSFLYSNDYGVFFGIDNKDATGDGAQTTIPRKEDGNLSSIISNGSTYTNVVKAIKAIAVKMISDANVNATTEAGGQESAAMKAKKVEDTDIKLSDGTATPTEAGKWYVVVKSAGAANVGCDGNTADNAKYFTISEVKLSKANAAGTGYEFENSGDGKTGAKFPGTSTFSIYPAGKCYYRLNIQDESFATGISPLRYAVMRNYWYQVSLNSFKDLGYPNPAIAAGTATDALGADTYVGATVTVKDWAKKTMKPDVDL